MLQQFHRLGIVIAIHQSLIHSKTQVNCFSDADGSIFFYIGRIFKFTNNAEQGAGAPVCQVVVTAAQF